MFAIGGLVCVVADHLTAGEIYRWAQADARAAVLLGYKPDGRWVSLGGTVADGVWSRVRSMWPKKICDALFELLRPSKFYGQSGSVCASGSLLLQELMRDEHANYPQWKSKDLDLFGTCTPATVSAVREFLNVIHDHVWAINKADSCFAVLKEQLELKKSAKRFQKHMFNPSVYDDVKTDVPALHAHDIMMAPIDEFQIYHKPMRQRGNLFDDGRRRVKSTRYSKHLPTVTYTVYLADAATRDKCVHGYPDQLNSPHAEDNVEPCPAKHLPSIDIILIAEPESRATGNSAGPVGGSAATEFTDARLFDWISSNFDFDICANALFGRRLHCRYPSSIFTKQAHFRPDQYCYDVDALKWKVNKKRRMEWDICKTNIRRHLSLQNCICRNIVYARLTKYEERGFTVILDPAKDDQDDNDSNDQDSFNSNNRRKRCHSELI